MCYVEILGEKGIKEGSWDSIHVAKVMYQQKKAKYSVTSTVFLKMISTNPIYGNLEIAGTLSKLVNNELKSKFIRLYREKTKYRWMQRAEMTSILLTSVD